MGQPQHVFQDHARFGPRGVQPGELLKGGSGLTGHDPLEQVEDQGAIRKPQHVPRSGRLDDAALVADGLIKDG